MKFNKTAFERKQLCLPAFLNNIITNAASIFLHNYVDAVCAHITVLEM